MKRRQHKIPVDEPVSFMARLKQHYVYRVVLGYAVGAWIVIQVTSRVFPYFGWASAVPILIILLLLGFPAVLVLAWTFIKPKDPAKYNTWQRRHWKLGAMFSVVVVVLVVISGFYAWRFSERHAQALTDMTAAHTVTKAGVPAVTSAPAAVTIIPAKSIAVLPFENLSDEKANAYFTDGMQDMILTKLADIGGLKVIARTSTEDYSSHPQNLKTISQQLGVATILEGSVQKAGNQVLINVQLIDVATSNHLWAEAYTRNLDNIFGVEGEVAQKVAEALKAKLTSTEAQAIAKLPTRSQPAYDAYLRGLYHQKEYQRTLDHNELHRSIELLRQAVKLDPDFADAYAQLASDYSMSGENPGDEAKLTRQALSLDPNNALAHQQLAFILLAKDPNGALIEAQRAVHLQPNNADMQVGLGITLAELGRFDDAIGVLRHAVALDPRVALQQEILAEPLMVLRRYAEARDALLTAMAIDPGNLATATKLAEVYQLGWGDLEAAHNVLNKVTAPVASSSLLSAEWYWQFLLERNYAKALAVLDAGPAVMHSFDAERRAAVYQAEGDSARAMHAYAQARAQLEPLVKARPEDAFLHLRLALVLAGLGERGQALDEARRAVALKPLAQHRVDGPSYLAALAEVQARTGDTAAAIEQLRSLLQMPAGRDISVPMLKLDPTWDSIRNDPRFQALLKKYANTSQNSGTSE